MRYVQLNGYSLSLVAILSTDMAFVGQVSAAFIIFSKSPCSYYVKPLVNILVSGRKTTFCITAKAPPNIIMCFFPSSILATTSPRLSHVHLVCFAVRWHELSSSDAPNVQARVIRLRTLCILCQSLFSPHVQIDPCF